MKAVKHELGPAGRDLNFNAYADNRSLFRYDMHTLAERDFRPVDRHLDAVRGMERGDLRRAGRGRPARGVVADGRYLEATREVLREHGALWFYDESYVISRRRE